MKFFVLLVFPIILSVVFYFLLRNDFHYGDFERVLHPDYSRNQGDITFENEDYKRKNEFFDCSGVKCHGWMYLSAGADEDRDPEIITIVCHGFGVQKDSGPENTAIEIVSKIGAAMTFDYRYSGGSDGVPRNLISPSQQVEDVHSAISHVRNRYPTSKIALLGSSFGGGHVLVAASEYHEKHVNDGDKEALLAVFCLVGHMRGSSTLVQTVKERGVIWFPKILVVGALDILLSKIGFGPIMIAMYAIDEDHQFGMLSMPREDFKGLFLRHPKHYLGGWQNLLPVRVALGVFSYSPIDYVDSIQYPVMFVAAENDNLCPVRFVEEAYLKVKKNQPKSKFVVVENVNHYQFFQQESIEFVTAKAVEFLKTLER